MDAETIALHRRCCQSCSKGASAYTPKWPAGLNRPLGGRGLLGAGIPPIDPPDEPVARTASVLAELNGWQQLAPRGWRIGSV